VRDEFHGDLTHPWAILEGIMCFSYTRVELWRASVPDIEGPPYLDAVQPPRLIRNIWKSPEGELPYQGVVRQKQSSSHDVMHPTRRILDGCTQVRRRP
jgi:hypothetical protein